jgi:hypothetical protein
MSKLIPHATRVVDGSAPLYLGAVASARSAGPLRAANIKCIVDLTAKGVDHEGVRHKGIRYLHIDVADVPAAATKLGKSLPSTTAFIAKARAAGSGVLVHCHYGKVRNTHARARAHTHTARVRGREGETERTCSRILAYLNFGHVCGQSRSAATVIAYLVAETETSLQDAHALCKVAILLVDCPCLAASALAPHAAGALLSLV